MMLTYRRGKTKATCPCGAQSPLLRDEEWEAWKRSPVGKTWLSVHRPHGKAEAIARGGKTESLDEALAKTRKSQPESVPAGDDDLPEALR